MARDFIKNDLLKSQAIYKLKFGNYKSNDDDCVNCHKI